MKKINIQMQDATVEALFHKADAASRCVVFAAGRSGTPDRFLPFLEFLVDQGCTVIAPYFERMASSFPTERELSIRLDVLRAALDSVHDSRVLTVGIGHSIGASLLIAAAGGQMWMSTGQRLPTLSDERFKKLVLMAPATGFFQAPGALESVLMDLQIWYGSIDTITPLEQMDVLRRGISENVPVEFRVVEGAGHFSFMNNLPPNIEDPMENRDKFLGEFATEVSQFVFA